MPAVVPDLPVNRYRPTPSNDTHFRGCSAGRRAAKPAEKPPSWPGLEVVSIASSTGTLDVPLSVERAYRSADWPDVQQRIEPSDSDAATVHMRSSSRMLMLDNGRATFLDARPAMSCVLVDMDRTRVCHLSGAFETVTFQLPRKALAVWARENDFKSFAGLSYTSDSLIEDSVIRNFAVAVVPSIVRMSGTEQLFVDYVLQAVMDHIVRTFGCAQHSTFKGGLAPWQVRTARDLVDANFDGALSLKTIADACNLSVSHFVKSFRATLGTTPHQYLLRTRIERALALMSSRHVSLTEIAMRCGFADQSHFTRTFSKVVGVAPGAWRRASEA